MTKLTAKFPKNVALIVVDAQYGFMPEGKELVVPEGEEIVPVINNIRDAFNTVVFTKDFHPKNHKSFAVNNNAKIFTQKDFPYGAQTMWPEHCVQGTKGAELHKDLIVRDKDLTLLKGTNPEIDSLSAFIENDGVTAPKFDNGKTLAEEMKARGIDTLVFAGLAREICVALSVDGALKAGFNTVMVMDATKPFDKEADKIKMDELEANGTKLVEAKELPKLFAA